MIRIEDPGVMALVEDLGRPGRADQGVPPSGAADRGSHLRANALVGNAPGAATLEIIAPGFTCVAEQDVVAALTGAPAVATRDGRPLPHDAVFRLRRGERLRLGAPAWGLRTHLGLRGGIGAQPVLGSRATDVLSGLGPPPLRAGDRLPLAADVDDQDWRAPAAAQGWHGDLIVPVLSAPGAAWIDPGPLADVVSTVTAASNRTAVRLDGPPLTRRRPDEFPTQGLVRGAVQIPTDGRPIVFLADHPVTGGYPVIGVVVSALLDRLAQLRAGDRLRLRLG